MTADPNVPLRETPDSVPTERMVTGRGSESPTAVEEPPLPADEGILPGIRLWGHRIGVLIFVFVCASAGVVLVIFPWRAEWTDNYFLFRYPGLRAIVASAFFRGVCSGLGVIDIWIGFWEALHYRE